MSSPSIVLEREAVVRDERQQVWSVAGSLKVLVLPDLRRPVAYLNLDGLDIFHLMIDLGAQDFLSEKGLDIETSHGVRHNCFRFQPEQLEAFLEALCEFYVSKQRTVREKSSRQRKSLKEWRQSWWDEVTQES